MLDTQELQTSALEHIKSLTLLCVEDNKTTQLLYEALFEDYAKNIFFAYDGQEGFEKFSEENIDIIITDYDMPICNGMEMIEKIRSVDKNVPIILVSAIESVDIIVEALRLNVNNFIRKPIINHEVLEAIANASKLLIANHYLEEEKNRKIKEFEKKKSTVHIKKIWHLRKN